MALDEVIHQPQRLRIMVTLYRHHQASFPELRDALGLSDGNLANHVDRLIRAGYVRKSHVFTGMRFQVRYNITSAGSKAFQAYADTLRSLLDATKRKGDIA